MACDECEGEVQCHLDIGVAVSDGRYRTHRCYQSTAEGILVRQECSHRGRPCPQVHSSGRKARPSSIPTEELNVLLLMIALYQTKTLDFPPCGLGKMIETSVDVDMRSKG